MLKMLAKQKQGGGDNRAKAGRENKSVARPTKVTRIEDALSTNVSTNSNTNRAKLRYAKDSSRTKPVPSENPETTMNVSFRIL